MTGRYPEIDLKPFSFPSDRLTVKALRAVEPGLFASASPADLHESFSHSDCAAMLFWERVAARQAYQAALGQPLVDAEPREELVEMLNDHYREYGLSSGPHQTEQLIRRVELQASNQARKHLGKGR